MADQPRQKFYELRTHVGQLAKFARSFVEIHTILEEHSGMIDEVARTEQTLSKLLEQVAQRKGELNQLDRAVEAKSADVNRAVGQLDDQLVKLKSESNRQQAETSERENVKQRESREATKAAEVQHQGRLRDMRAELDREKQAHAAEMARMRAESASAEEQLTALRRSLQSLKARVAEIV